MHGPPGMSTPGRQCLRSRWLQPRRGRAGRLLGLPAAIGIVILAGACATLSSTARMNFQPLAGERTDRAFTADLTRSCVLDDCRVQRVEMRWPSGELLTGELRLLSVGVAPVEPAVGPAPATGAVLDDVPRRRPGVMALAGDRGSQLRCELTFSAGTRHAVGVCKGPAGSTYAVDL